MFLRIYLLQANGIEANRHNWYQKLLMSKKIRLLLYALVEYNPQIEMFARFKMKSSFHKTKRII